MKTQIETSEKLIKKIKWVIESQDETHKIERLEKMISQILDFAKMTKSQLKFILKREIDRKDGTEDKELITFAIAFALLTELDLDKILRQSQDAQWFWDLSKEKIFIF